jgi:hypothetical protein
MSRGWLGIQVGGSMARLVRHHDHIVRATAVALAAGLALHGGAGRAQAQVPTRLAYSANVDGSVGIFSVSPTTGALAALGSVPSSGDPTAIAVGGSSTSLTTLRTPSRRMASTPPPG